MSLDEVTATVGRVLDRGAVLGHVANCFTVVGDPYSPVFFFSGARSALGELVGMTLSYPTEIELGDDRCS